jgi:hypothetical protein
MKFYDVSRNFKWPCKKSPHFTVYYSDQQMYNIYINDEFYIVSTICFDAFASSSGSLAEDDANASKHVVLRI